MAEYLDIVDENGIPTGETVERETAHAKGSFGTTPALDAKALASLLAGNPILLKKALESVRLAITPDFISEAQISKTHHIRKQVKNRMKIRR